jgi:RND family efflux transporter MFP subunit
VTDPQNKASQAPGTEPAAFAVEIEVMKDQRSSVRKWWALFGLALTVAALGGGYCLTLGNATPSASAEETLPEEPVPAVEVVRPTLGGAPRTTTQPATVEAYESVKLFAYVSGYLKEQTVDIGSFVTRGQVLAKIAVPDLEAQVKQHRQAVKQAEARLKQMQEHLKCARADLEMAEATITQASANLKSAQARRRFREKQYNRLHALWKTGSIEEKVVDEAEDRWTASVEAVNAAEAAVVTARANRTSAAAKIEQALADVGEADARIGVEKALLENAEVKVGFATIRAPFNGVITQRSMFPNDFVRAATESGSIAPLLTVARTDKMRVVVQIPDRDVPYADPGDPATIEIDALGNQTFEGKLSRKSNAEDPQTRTMRVEIDLENSRAAWWWGGQDQIQPGMYGTATILLDPFANLVAIPSDCLVNSTGAHSASVYVVTEDNRVRLVPVSVGSDNGLKVVVHKGLTVNDRVVRHPSSELAAGMQVHVSSTGTQKTAKP